ncbi:DUF6684 family protein [Haloarculaceae archaeon H-GB2-1]|nr:hypothetical protein [Haloarculaceae archaeon H-GB1-1]MEA5389486.1 DUF6684 family protein [Haloarculaceae archaeon H-GB11]MEA5410061.1 DUF6684 family protein [Haloarculaceae archaeon H-GB2-1]
MANEPSRSGRWDWADRDTLLDVTVNLIPMGILVFFVGMFILLQPWGFDLFTAVLAHFLTLFPFLLLGILTYYAARAISIDEGRT